MDYFQKQYRFRNRPEKTPKQRYSRKKFYSKEEKLKLIREFNSIGAPLGMFCKWYGVGAITFKHWLEKFSSRGEQGLEATRSGRVAKEIPDAVKKEIIRIKIENPGVGMKKISDWFARNKFIRVNEKHIRKILKEDPQTAALLELPALRHGNSGKEPQRFERSRPGEMYQMDIMTFMLQGLYRVYVIGCLDDYSRFVVSIGLFRRQTTDRCLDVLRSAIERYGMPKEMLTDNGRQFYHWNDKVDYQPILTVPKIRKRLALNAEASREPEENKTSGGTVPSIEGILKSLPSK